MSTYLRRIGEKARNESVQRKLSRYVRQRRYFPVCTFPVTHISDPIPGEDTIYSHDNIGLVGSDDPKERFCLYRQIFVHENLSGLVHDTEVHCSCMQVNSAIELMLSRVESHKASF